MESQWGRAGTLLSGCQAVNAAQGLWRLSATGAQDAILAPHFGLQ